MAENDELPTTEVGDILQMPRWHHQEWRKMGTRSAVFKFDHKAPRDQLGVFLFLGTFNPKKGTPPALAAVLEGLGWVRKETTVVQGEPNKSSPLSTVTEGACRNFKSGLLTDGG